MASFHLLFGKCELGKVLGESFPTTMTTTFGYEIFLLRTFPQFILFMNFQPILKKETKFSSSFFRFFRVFLQWSFVQGETSQSRNDVYYEGRRRNDIIFVAVIVVTGKKSLPLLDTFFIQLITLMTIPVPIQPSNTFMYLSTLYSKSQEPPRATS